MNEQTSSWRITFGLPAPAHHASAYPESGHRLSAAANTVILTLGLMLAASPALADMPVRFSPHNLSVSGPGTFRAAEEPEICIFCHGAHRTAPQSPLWNRTSSGIEYTPYSSSTAKARMRQPTGSSALCLSCHDGTVALGKLRNRSEDVRMLGGDSLFGAGRSELGTDLSDDHPVSIAYDNSLVSRSEGELRDPALLPPEVKLDAAQQLQCTTCHDPHDNTYGRFLVMDNRGAALCVACHAKRDWPQASHNLSAATWDGEGPNPWPYVTARTVADAACQSCHTPHQAGTPQRLLVFPGEEDNCLSCHEGHVAAADLGPEFAKPSRHDIRATTGIHDPAEALVVARRHVECADCHNPHASRPGGATAPLAPGSLAGVSGVAVSGGAAVPASREYEVCFRCHADSPGKGESVVVRDRPETNTRLEFNTDNASFHPVVGQGRNPDVPSLRDPLRTSSLIYCTDCHNNDQGPRAGGRGPDGPHGSVYPPLLERKLEWRDFAADAGDNYALCYKCHSQESILGNQSFPFHRSHVVDDQTACTTCHDPHGVAAATHLINFNRTYVSANDRGQLSWSDDGRLQGTCNLRCHDFNHDNTAYDPNGLKPAAGRPGAASKSRKK